MNPQEQTLWDKIKAFPLDDPNIEFSFSDRLARDNGWTKSFALEVVEEYRKFLFLCCIADTGVTPSDPVDQAWHLHLTYTKSYWIDLCMHTLGKDIHHHPTKGGRKEGEKFKGYYDTTHHRYKELFGAEPPKHIWQNSHTRFTDIHFQRINTRQYWLIRKPVLQGRHTLIAAAVVLFALLFIQASFDTASYIFIGFLVLLGIWVYKKRGKGGESMGCTINSCGSDSGDGGHGDSGCSSGCSGCSGSGCSGCGGGD
jgi:hypothetical protein